MTFHDLPRVIRASVISLPVRETGKISSTTLAIIGNEEALAVNRDPIGAHGRVVHESGSAAIKMACAAGGTAKYDMHAENMTVSQARAWCIGTARCAGFCAEVPFGKSTCGGDDAVVEAHFMDGWAIGRTGSNASWTHWHAPPPSPPLLQIFAKPMASAVAEHATEGEGAAEGAAAAEEHAGAGAGAGARSGARRRAVAVFNRGATTVNATVDWSMIRIDGPIWGKAAHVRDLWAHAELGVFDGGYTVPSLAPHATALLMVTEVVGEAAQRGGISREGEARADGTLAGRA